MLSTYITEKLLGLKGVIIKNVEEQDGVTQITIALARKAHRCPCCEKETDIVHDYRLQPVKDIPAFGNQVVLFYHKRRYRCKACGKCFCEKNTFLPRYHRMTNRLSAYVIDRLRETCSFTSIAKQVNLSVSTVIRIFDLVQYGKPQLGSVVAIDEFKGNTTNEKYQCILTDPENGRVLDILPNRYMHNLAAYFKDLDRSNTSFVVSDMWQPYADIFNTYFKNATHVLDRYHVIRQVVWAFEAVRKEEQKRFSKSHRRYFKRSKSLLIKCFDFLSDEQKQQVNVMLYSSPNLSSAYYFKEAFFKVTKIKDAVLLRQELSSWVLNAQNSTLPRFRQCANTFTNWGPQMINAFTCTYSNGFTEGCNNKIKVLKRNAYGFRNFNRFRNRILHVFNRQKAAMPA